VSCPVLCISLAATGGGIGTAPSSSSSSSSLVVDILAAPARMPLGLQGQLLEKQGLGVADELREARQVLTGGDERDLICDLQEQRPPSS
jgi:hypothetical protein